MRTRCVALVGIALLGCGKQEPAKTDEGSTAASGGSTPAPPPPAPPPPAPDAPPPPPPVPPRPAPDPARAAPVETPKLGAPVALEGAMKGLAVQPFDDWTTAQKNDDLSWSNSCCIHKIRLRPEAAKLRNIDDLRAEIGDIRQLLTTQLDEVIEQHEVENGWWAVIKGPSLTIPGDTNTAVLRVVHLKGKTYVCSTLTATGAAGRDVRPDEVVTACSTLRSK